MAAQVPLVDYLVIGSDIHLEAEECTGCGARFFGRRNACASCFADEFKRVRIANEGILTTYTIVAHAAPGIPVPFVSGIVECEGTQVKANLVNVTPAPENVRIGMRVRLAPVSVGTDDDGVEAIGFGYEPLG